MLAKVTVRAPAVTCRYLVAPERLLVFGRGSQCDLAISETSVSRTHCTVALLGGELHLADLGAARGVVHRGQRVQQCRLAVGDRARLGAAELRFDELLAPEAVAAEADELAAKGCVELADHHREPAPASAPAATAVGVAPESPAPTDADLDDGDEWVGRTLGAYRITGVLGAGGSATVYRAEQVQLAREVALKVLRQPAEGADAAAVAAFLREARAAATLADPRLVQVFDLGQDRNRHFLSMEFVRGGSLAAWIRRDGPRPWRQLLPILCDVAGALQLAHRAGLVHRDVKPANILLTFSGGAKLADLGLVRDIGGAGDRTGTAAFMAPEQLDGTSVDGRADLYALGCTTYAALAGQPPFVGTVKEILRQKRSQQPPPFEPSLGVPVGVDRLVRQQLLAFAPEDRPADAGEVLDELERLEHSGGGLPLPRRSRQRRPARSGGGAGGLWAALAIGLVLIAIVWVIWKQRAG